MKSKNTVIAGLGVHHPALTVQDLQRSRRFYMDGLGFSLFVEFGEEPHRNAILNAGDDTYIELMSGDSPAPAQGKWGHVALRVKNCETAYKTALQAGARPLYEPRRDTMRGAPEEEGVPVIWAYVIGPDDEWIELCQYEIG